MSDLCLTYCFVTWLGSFPMPRDEVGRAMYGPGRSRSLRRDVSRHSRAHGVHDVRDVSGRRRRDVSRERDAPESGFVTPRANSGQRCLESTVFERCPENGEGKWLVEHLSNVSKLMGNHNLVRDDDELSELAESMWSQDIWDCVTFSKMSAQTKDAVLLGLS